MISDRGAEISPCGRYRYRLWRKVSSEFDPYGQIFKPTGTLLYVMLNPSTADAMKDDPTIRKCDGFARVHHFARFEVVNLYAWRSTDKKALLKVADPVGPENDATIIAALAEASQVIVAWGAIHKKQEHRSWRVSALLAESRLKLTAPPMIYSLGSTKAGHPNHPLMLPYAQRLDRF